MRLHLEYTFFIGKNPSIWANPNINQIDPDDYLHNPDPKRDRENDKGGNIFTARGLANIGCLVFLVVGLTTLFTLGAFNIGGVNASGQVPQFPNNLSLIDKHTPIEAYSKTSFEGVEMTLVFSDEFEVDGRSFYPGDDPYWEAADLNYWQTGDLEWYDPSAATTKDGKLVLTLSNTPEHNLSYTSGMITSWNKFCFTGGRIEVSVILPGSNKVPGLWPAVWTMGNLGRAGYGASLEGMWPYTYDSCDVGTLPNQTLNGQPEAATINGDPTKGNVLSWLQGQKLSSCTCKGEPHPGPIRPDGTFVGRGAPEIDVLEAQVNPVSDIGTVSQSCQWAPFDASYIWDNSSANIQINDPTITQLNPYKGGALQEATSGLSLTNASCYELNGACSTVYGYEYLPDRTKGYISWINNGQQAWTIQAAGMGPNPIVNISQRIIPEEPMVRP
ncbi:hypothetical protein Clacol_004266 [Clathrus columnatus]|uniref:GH16 domain-containing protein n=1 Tax=Clathrus columnatus TaxID=1419009 RepID=A0AAV5AAU8_9AGAM|nr:hypothetical protein Clacol_004266 [Clathrus columnatus]